MRYAFLLVPSLLVGCASSRTSSLIVGDAIDPRPSTAEVAPPPEAITESVGEPSTASFPAPVESALLREPAPAAPQDEGLHGSRFTIKGGYYGSTEDAVDDGYIINLAWTQFINKLFAVELEIGYLDVDGSDQNVDTDVWAIPVMLNGRVNLPIWVLEGYAGVGIGTFYYDAEAKGALSADDSGFLFGGDAFIGASINLADAVALGLEFKYYATDEISDVNTGLDAYALMLTLGWNR